MAPNNKKKKAVANPNRGFATVSVASKRKDETSESAEAPHEDDQEPVAPDQPLKSFKNISVKEAETSGLEKLSPEELEAHLEDAELQALVDKYASALKKNSSRNMSRLVTERRILRTQATPLKLDMRISDTDVNHILDLSAAEQFDAEPTLKINGKSGEPISEDDMCVQLWELRLTLQKLGLVESRSETLLGAMARCSFSREMNDSLSGRGSAGQLERALDWLALNASPEEVGTYEQKNHSITREEGESTDGASQFETPDVTPMISGMATPEETTELERTSTVKPSQIEDIPNNSNDNSGYSSDTSESDLEPEELQTKYLDAKALLYEVEAELFDSRTADLKASRAVQRLTISAPQGRKVQKLCRLLKKIESDVLFDHYEADVKWKAQVHLLAQGRPSRRAPKPPAAATSSSAKPLPERDESQSSPQESGHDLEEHDDLFGAMFTDSRGGAIISGGASTVEGNASIILKDFGKWTGTNPRRVLEDACRARDPKCSFSLKAVTSSSFSNRQSLVIQWSTAQAVTVPVPLTSVKCSLTSRVASFTMDTIATPTVVQSEAYISTIALFTLFASSPKEERCHSRLPTTWRDVWSELVALKKDQNDSEDKQTLRSIRDIVRSNIPRVVKDIWVPQKLQPGKGEHQKGRSAREHAGAYPERLKDAWARKISSSTYQKMLSSRIKLPIWNFKEEILGELDRNQAIIICGETGCGKSTQVPNFILEQEMLAGRECRIYVTEPRRISAISLAQRVGEELGENKSDIGTRNSEVGYAIRLESKVNDQTRLVYATTGVVVRMLERPDDLRNVTHLVLDEVHERSIDSDFLLIVLKRLMIQRPDLKVVLMSATLDAERFSNYLGGAPICNVPGRTFPVEVKFLEDAVELAGYSIEDSRNAAKDDLDADGDETETDNEKEGKAGANKLDIDPSNLKGQGYSQSTQEVLKKFDEYKINYDLMTLVLHKIATDTQLEQYSKAILVFMPGMFEIRRLTDRISSHPTFAQGWVIHQLHSSVASEDQEKVFFTPPNGMRKIVIATNIAETGITIPDVTAVVDSGKEKVMRFDERRQLSRLVESFISRANAKQRRGRAGRVQSGICFHLFRKDRHDRLLSEQQTPEMLRLSLQDLVLRVKMCNLGGIESALSEALDPPSAKNIRRAIEALKDVKALTNAEDLTPLGRQLARLPLDVFLGKLVLNGLFFQCLDVAVTIAAIMSSKSPFSSSFWSKSQVDAARLSFKKGDSDLITLYNAYCAWKRVRASANTSEFQFCLKNCLSPKALAGIEDLKLSLCVALVDGGFLRLDGKSQSSLKRARWFTGRQRSFFSVPEHLNRNSDNDLIVNSVIACSFYPKLLAREGKGWRNVANNQAITLSPASINKRADQSTKWLSFYSILMSSNQRYNANETSVVDELAIALLCGDAEFKMYSGVITIDGNRIRFAVKDWKSMLALKLLSTQIREMLTKSFRNPGRKLSEREVKWFDMWQQIFSPHIDDAVKT